jgi:hypothetical protein
LAAYWHNEPYMGMRRISPCGVSIFQSLNINPPSFPLP